MQGVSTASGSGAERRPPAKPPRSALTLRDMIGALVLLAAFVLVIGGLTRGCSFAPTGPTSDPSAGPTVDAPAQLRVLASSTPFVLRVPTVPAEWRANAVGVVRVGPGGNRGVRTGYVLPTGHYLRVVQSDAAEADLVTEEAKGTPTATGPVDVGGTTWVTYSDGTPEQLRVAQVDGVPRSAPSPRAAFPCRTRAAGTVSGRARPR